MTTRPHQPKLARYLRTLPPRISAWNPGRRAAITALLVAPLAGAVLAAATHPQPRFRDSAEAVIAATPGSPALEKGGEAPRDRVRTLATVLRLPQVLEVMRQDVYKGEIEGRLSVEYEASSGLLRVIARDRSTERAVDTANRYVKEGLTFIKVLQTLGGRDLLLGDFEQGTDDWFGRRPVGSPERPLLRQVKGPAKVNSGSLLVRCPPREGCGAFVRFFYPFKAKGTYTVKGWARSSSSPTPVTLFFSNSPRREQRTDETRLGKRWTPFQATWVPERDGDSGEVSFRIREPMQTAFNIDGVSLRDGTARPPEPAPEERTFTRGRYVTVLPAQPAGTARSSTALWALGGAGGGLLVAVGGVAFGRAAGRRRRQ